MRSWPRVLLLGLLLAAATPAAAIIDQTVNAVGIDGSGRTIYRYSYDLSRVQLLLNQELFISFDALVFLELFNGVAAGNFDLLLFQPGNPVGADGGYSLLALQDNPAMTGPFSVDVILTGAGPAPGSLPFEINQFDAQGQLAGTLEAGLTGVPEPGSVSLVLLVGSAMAVVGLKRAAQRSRR